MIDYGALKKISQQSSDFTETRDGLYTIKIKGQYLHSFYSPSSEAKRLLEGILGLDKENTLVILLGIGLGYHLEILEKAGFQNIIIIERNPYVFKLFQQVYQISPGHFLISLDENPEKLDSIFSLLEIQKISRIKTVVFRGSYQKEIYQPFEERVERLLKVKLGDFTTRLKFEELWFINIIKNISNLKKSFLIHELFNKKMNAPMLIVSAGPSLKNSLNELKKFQENFIIVAVDTALLALYEAGIKPDFVYSLDSQVHNLQDLSMIDKKYLSDISLIYDMVVHPSLPSYFGEKNFAANTAHLDFDYYGNPFLIKNELVNWIENRGGFRIGDIETGGSVSTSAFHFAYLAGAKAIILLGQDLAYSFKTSHSSSTSHFYRLLAKNNRLCPLESTFMNILLARKHFPTKNIGDNGEVITDFILNNFRGWFEESAKSIKRMQPDFSLLNATQSGAKIKFFEEKPLEEIAWQFPEKLNKKKLFDLHLIDFNKIDKIMHQVSGLQEFIKSIEIKPDLFQKIASSEWAFLNRYFMRESVLFDKYENFEKAAVERKIFRLLKNLEGIVYG
jgi:hypothetical protein